MDAIIEKAIEIGRDFGDCCLSIDFRTGEKPKLKILVFSLYSTTEERIAKALKYVPRLKRHRVGSDEIWADANTEEGIEIELAQIAKCVRVETEEEVEEPEMQPTGKMVNRTVKKIKFICPEENAK
jgi:hypothetical protein